MKIRSKSNPEAVYTVLEESPSFYLVEAMPLSPPWVMPKVGFEPVKEETWRDVTDECGVVDGQGERDGIKHFGPSNAVCQIYYGYRLRKVSVIRAKDGRPSVDTYAFIVERREEA